MHPPLLINELPTQQRSPDGSARVDVAMAAVLVGVMYYVGNEPTIYNALIRIGCWVAFLLFVVRTPFLWQPGPSSWFVIHHVIGFGSWSFFYLTGTWFFSHSAGYRASAGSDPTTGFMVDSGCFLFMAVAWSVVRLLGPRSIFAEQASLASPIFGSVATRGVRMIQLIVAGFVGGSAAILSPYAPSVLIQPLRLFECLFPASMGILVLTSDPKEPALTRFRWPLILAGSYGIAVFSGSGTKGAIFLTLFYLTWFVGASNKGLRRTAFVAGIGIFVAFVALLPVFQMAKDTYHYTYSRSATLDALHEGIGDVVTTRRNYETFRGKNFAEGMWEYLGVRLCVAGMTRQYYEVYSERPLGYESLRVALRSTIPRLLDPNKISTNAYYNEIAILAGIGNRYDFTTSRKPSFQDESIVVWGKYGFLVGGLAFGLYLTILEYLAHRLAQNRASRAVLRFTWAPLGQLPYAAAITGGYIYVVAFCLLVVLSYCHWIWPHKECAKDKRGKTDEPVKSIRQPQANSLSR
jgi:hypothetical protein